MKVKLLISYNGSTFEGLQVQKHTSNTIMGELYKALKSLNIETKLHASGRTDAKVHAFKQVLHFEVPSFWTDIKKLKEFLQFKLPSSIKIRSLSFINKDFHARYSAKRRVYRYILNEKESNPFESDFITFTNHILDIHILNDSIKIFEGEHDFKFFKKTGGTNGSDIRFIYKTRVYRYKDKVVLYFEANGFLRSQIRLMVKFLLLINEKKLTKEQLISQLSCKNSYNTKLAPPNGLYLSNIIY